VHAVKGEQDAQPDQRVVEPPAELQVVHNRVCAAAK
jgi:hypothetical protein